MIRKKLIASACALLMATSSTAGVFAGDEIAKDASQQQNKPAQEMMQDQSRPELPVQQEMNGENRPADVPEMNGENKPADLPEMNGENRPADMPEMNGENKPADLPEMNGKNKPADQDEMNSGKAPTGPKEADTVRNELGKSGASDESVNGLLDDYKNAVDAERNATDEDAKMSAAKLVKDIVDAINAALEKLGLSVKINAPADKPEMTSNTSNKN